MSLGKQQGCVQFPIQLTPGKHQQPGALPAGSAGGNQAVKAALDTKRARGVPEALLRAAPYSQGWHNKGGSTGPLPCLQ